MNFYQHIASMGYPPEDYLDKEIINIYQSRDGYFAVGIEIVPTLDVILAAQKNKRKYKIYKRGKLDYDLLDVTPEEYLEMIIAVINLAKERRTKK